MLDVERLRAAIRRRRETAEVATKRWPDPTDARLGYVPTVIIEHIEACDPATVIRWLDADLVILDQHYEFAIGLCDACDEGIGWLCTAVRQIAGKYLDGERRG